jgi:hypothetical protein
MSGHHPFRELTEDFSPERQAWIADKVRLFKQDMALAELRKARQQSQAVCSRISRTQARGRPMPTNDMWIAASALQHGFAVFSDDGPCMVGDGIVGEPGYLDGRQIQRIPRAPHCANVVWPD